MKEKVIKAPKIKSPSFENAADDQVNELVQELVSEAISEIIIPANEVVIEQIDDKLVVTAQTPKQKAIKLLSELTQAEFQEYAKKYSINPATTEGVAEFLVTKKPASLTLGKIW